jgi:hypothetical protein
VKSAKIIDSRGEENPAEGSAVDRLRWPLLSLDSLMCKRLLTILLLLAMTTNAFAVIPPHDQPAGGCSEECCAVAIQHEKTAESMSAALCCALSCQQNAEPNLPQIFPAAPQKQEPKSVSASWRLLKDSSYPQQIKFPASPTRHLTGSSNRYLENNTFLI